MTRISADVDMGEHRYRTRTFKATPGVTPISVSGRLEVDQLKTEVNPRKNVKDRPILNVRPSVADYLNQPLMHRLKEGTFVARYPGDFYLFAVVDEEGFEPVYALPLEDIIWHTLVFMQVDPTDELFPTVNKMNLKTTRVREMTEESELSEIEIERVNQTPKFDQYGAKLIPNLIIKLFNPSRPGIPYDERGTFLQWLETWNGSLEYR